MSDPEIPTQPLLDQTVVNVGPPAQGPSSSRAYKVAGLTLLACVLIMGQAAIAYLLVNQGNDIKNLQDQNNNMNMKMTNGGSASVPVRMHIPMSPAMEMMDTTMEEESSGTKKPTTPITQCQLEAAGVNPGPIPGFQPRCDKLGRYEPQQCFQGQCWCVNPADGQPIPEDKSCMRPAFSGGLMTLNQDLETDDA
uniref:Thyroglobulin type-1 domain-containing protein n=1 Tax=Poecilia mexicana TaxID=48701 RepID=A0A3B3XLR5_9TELE